MVVLVEPKAHEAVAIGRRIDVEYVIAGRKRSLDREVLGSSGRELELLAQQIGCEREHRPEGRGHGCGSDEPRRARADLSLEDIRLGIIVGLASVFLFE